MVVAGTPNATTNGCGSPTFSPSAGAGSITFSGGTIAPGGTCIVTVDVTAPAVGTYNNTSGAVSAIGRVTGLPVERLRRALEHASSPVVDHVLPFGGMVLQNETDAGGGGDVAEANGSHGGCGVEGHRDGAPGK